ncbi:hypothetical protein GRF29_103g882843 [Pseudopithomyces chartarum]|uniref:Uncharacterized protein n=1 Tax=Pseudopithomyces chartarum TaxID=1892770 RepID=A0AAN6LY19_9PLEO|nr:hypothetical protein GRF29_103g882843 [Pseudopithomyces chartarum]
MGPSSLHSLFSDAPKPISQQYVPIGSDSCIAVVFQCVDSQNYYCNTTATTLHYPNLIIHLSSTNTELAPLVQFSVAILALFAASATAMTCGVSGSACDGFINAKRAVGFTAKAREFLRTREVEAPKEVREAVAVEAVEVQI